MNRTTVRRSAAALALARRRATAPAAVRPPPEPPPPLRLLRHHLGLARQDVDGTHGPGRSPASAPAGTPATTASSSTCKRAGHRLRRPLRHRRSRTDGSRPRRCPSPAAPALAGHRAATACHERARSMPYGHRASRRSARSRWAGSFEGQTHRRASASGPACRSASSRSTTPRPTAAASSSTSRTAGDDRAPPPT